MSRGALAGKLTDTSFAEPKHHRTGDSPESRTHRNLPGETCEVIALVDTQIQLPDGQAAENDESLQATPSLARRVLTGVARLFAGWSISTKQDIDLVVQQHEESVLESGSTPEQQYSEMQERLDRYRGWF